MQRRAWLQLALIAPLLVVGAGHTPYRQWAVYRRKHLLILTDKQTPGSFELGQRLAAVLASKLPASQARVARAPHSARIASLLGSQQLDLALLKAPDALALLRGQPPFADYGAVALRSLAVKDDLVLVCRADFPDLHAYLVSKTLAEQNDTSLAVLPGAAAERYPPLHPGSLAYQQGLAPPEPPELSAEQDAVRHRH